VSAWREKQKAHRDAASARRGRQLHRQGALQRRALQGLVLVLGPRRVGVGEVLAGLPEDAAENASHVRIVWCGELHHVASRRPQGLRQQGMEVRRQLQRRAEPLSEDDGTSAQRPADSESPGHPSLPAPRCPYQPLGTRPDAPLPAWFFFPVRTALDAPTGALDPGELGGTGSPRGAQTANRS
jgi:hypothetical protein